MIHGCTLDMGEGILRTPNGADEIQRIERQIKGKHNNSVVIIRETVAVNFKLTS